MGSYTPDNLSLSEDYGINIPEPTQTLYQILNESAGQYPERTALVSCHQPWNMLFSSNLTQEPSTKGSLRWSYKQVQTASDLLAAYLAKSGISKGDALVVVLHSCVEWVLCFWAAARLGCPFVPINPSIVSRANEIQHILSALERIGALVADDESIVKVLSRNAPADVHNTSIRLVLGNVGMNGWTAFDDA